MRRRAQTPALIVDAARVGVADAKCTWCGERRRCVVFVMGSRDAHVLTRETLKVRLCRRCCLDGAQLVAHSMAATARRPHARPCMCFDCCEWDHARAPAWREDEPRVQLELEPGLGRDDAEGERGEQDAGDDENGDGGGLHLAQLTPAKSR